MFNIRRSMNPPRRSTTETPTPSIPQDPPPLPAPTTLPHTSSSHQTIIHSPSESGSGSPIQQQQKSNPYRHHLQQSQSKARQESGSKKLLPPVENKAHSPKRPMTTSGIIGRVSSLFSSPSSSSARVASRSVPDPGADDKSTTPSSKSKRKSLITKLTKGSPQKSESVSKTKRVPPPLAVTSSSAHHVFPHNPSSSLPNSHSLSLTVNNENHPHPNSSAFRPFRSLTRSRSKLAQHILGLGTHEPVENLATTTSNHGFDLQQQQQQQPLTSSPSRNSNVNYPPRSPRSPRTPKSPFFYNGGYGAESDDGINDIRRPSGLGRRVSTGSLPPSPFGGRYPWEAGSSPQVEDEGNGVKEGVKNDADSELPPPPPSSGSVTGSSARSLNEGRGTLRETFRFPNKSVSNLVTVGRDETDVISNNNNNDNGTQKTGRARALSSPGLLLSIGRKMKEKLEREREFGKLRSGVFKVKELKDDIKPDQEPETSEVEVTQDVKEEEEPVLQVVVVDTAPVAVTYSTDDGAQYASHASEDTYEPQDHDLRYSMYSNESEPPSAGGRDRMMSFSLVHQFPEPPSTHPSPPSSALSSPDPSAFAESGPVVFNANSPFSPFPSFSAATLSAPSTPPSPHHAPKTHVQASLPVSDPETLKRSSSSTMDTLMSTATSTTATSLGVEVCNAVRGRIESCLPREMVVTPLPFEHDQYLVRLEPVLQPLTVSMPTPTSITTASPSPTSPALLPSEILGLALSFLPSKKDIAPVARVSKAYAVVVRALLYDTVDLDALAVVDGDAEDLEEVAEEAEWRVKKLLSTLVKRKDLATLVTKFVCREWPEWFPPSPYADCLKDDDELEDEDYEEREEMAMQHTFLASTLVLAVSRMTELKELVLPSYHPFLLSDLSSTRWGALKSIEFCNVVMKDDEALEMFTWLEGMTGVENLLFPRLVEKAEVTSKISNESIKSLKSVKTSPKSKRSSTVSSKRLSVKSLKRESTGIGPGMLVTPMTPNFSACEVQTQKASEHEQTPVPPPVRPLAKYARSWTFLPDLKVLQAPPTMVSILASAAEEPSQWDHQHEAAAEEKPWRRLEEVTINVDMTLYSGLRPTALVQGLHGVKRLGFRFGERVDRRTVEKVLVAVGAALGTGLEELDVEFVGAWAAVNNESLYKVFDAVLPRYHDLHQITLRYSRRDVMSVNSETTLPPVEGARLGQWMRYCPRLDRAGLLSGSSWRRPT